MPKASLSVETARRSCSEQEHQQGIRTSISQNIKVAMLKSHMDSVEQSLLAISRIPAKSGHTLHKGTPREAFIKEYLEDHLPSNVAVGIGEMVDENSRPWQKRNQYDIVIYNLSYQKLYCGGGIFGFLIENLSRCLWLHVMQSH